MRFIHKIASAIIVMVLIFSSQVSVASALDASSLVVKNFGGIIISFVPPSPLCPVAHTLIYDYATGTTIGIATVFSTIVYSHGNLFTPSNFVLGNATQVPIPCVAPYPIYPIIEVGTSL